MDGIRHRTVPCLTGSSDELIGMVITDSNNSISTYYYLRNAQGDITGIVNSSGKKIISYTYDVLGNCTETYHSTTTTENANYLKVNVLNPFAYRGYCYDADMGLYYLQSRYYDPNTGRFINADDTNYLNATGTVLGCNLFAYCENEPVNKVDPKGNLSFVGENPRNGTQAALRKFSKQVIGIAKAIEINIKKIKDGLSMGEISYVNNRKVKKIDFIIGTRSIWQSATSQKFDKYTNMVNDAALGFLDSAFGYFDDPGGSTAPYGVVGGIIIAAYAGIEIKYSNFKKIYDSVYGSKGLDPQNRRYYFLLRIQGEKKYNGWYAVPDTIGRVVKIK